MKKKFRIIYFYVNYNLYNIKLKDIINRNNLIEYNEPYHEIPIENKVFIQNKTSFIYLLEIHEEKKENSIVTFNYKNCNKDFKIEKVIFGSKIKSTCLNKEINSLIQK